MKGQILIPMPHLSDPYFAHSLVLICDHDVKGAMGLIINKSFDDDSVKKVFPTLIINDDDINAVISPMYFGGPVDLERGFLLHSPDFSSEDTYQVSPGFALTSNSEIIDAIKAGQGPKQYRMMLGYAGWDAGQLEREIENGDWLFQEADPEFVFSGDDGGKWLGAAQSFGINVAPGTEGIA